MQLVRSVLADPPLTYHLFACYDMTAERKLDAVQVWRGLRAASMWAPSRKAGWLCRALMAPAAALPQRAGEAIPCRC